MSFIEAAVTEKTHANAVSVGASRNLNTKREFESK